VFRAEQRGSRATAMSRPTEQHRFTLDAGGLDRHAPKEGEKKQQIGRDKALAAQRKQVGAAEASRSRNPVISTGARVIRTHTLGL